VLFKDHGKLVSFKLSFSGVLAYNPNSLREENNDASGYAFVYILLPFRSLSKRALREALWGALFKSLIHGAVSCAVT